MTNKYFIKPVLILTVCLMAMGFMKPEKSSEKPLPPELLTVLETYKKAAIAQDAKALISVAHPAFFKLAPREKLIESLKARYENQQAPTIKDITFKRHNPEKTYSGGTFITVHYQMEMTLPRPGDATPQIDKMMIEMISQTFGKKTKIEIDEKNSLVMISYASMIIGLLEKEQGWTVLDHDQFEILAETKLLPEDLIKKVMAEK